jgi:hypothetical protein
MAWKNDSPKIWGKREKKGFLGEITRPFMINGGKL